MSKKEYRKPALRVMALENVDMVCTSPDGPSTFSIHEDTGDYGDGERPGVSSDIWGCQWSQGRR